jgi:hypothetical protein
VIRVVDKNGDNFSALLSTMQKNDPRYRQQRGVVDKLETQSQGDNFVILFIPVFLITEL